VNFGQEYVGGSVWAQTSLSVFNEGNNPLTVSSVALVGTDAGDFAQMNDCAGAQVASQFSCNISVIFAPTTTGARSASIQITDSDSSSPQGVSLTGTGTARPGVYLSPAVLQFGQQNDSSTSAPQIATLTNGSNAPLNISYLGIDTGGFAQTNNCGSSVAAGSTCTISVTFSPTGVGPIGGSIEIDDTATNSPQAINLLGTGLPQATPPGTYAIQATATYSQSFYSNDTHVINVPVNVQ
jgi:hypothetical protein